MQLEILRGLAWCDGTCLWSSYLGGWCGRVTSLYFTTSSSLKNRKQKYKDITITDYCDCPSPSPCPQRWKVSPYCQGHHALQTQGQDTFQLELTWKPLLWEPDFMITEGYMKTLKGWKHAVLCSYKFLSPHQWSSGHSSGTHTFVVISSSLNGLKRWSTRRKSSLVLKT